MYYLIFTAMEEVEKNIYYTNTSYKSIQNYIIMVFNDYKEVLLKQVFLTHSWEIYTIFILPKTNILYIDFISLILNV